MAVEAFKDLRRRIRLTLQDSDTARWTDEELDEYINESQLEIVRRTRSLRTQFPITTKENQEVYSLPEDYLDMVRIEDANGRELSRTSHDELRKSFGNGFRTITGDPESIYGDLDGDGKFRFYPRPKPSIEIPAVDFKPSAFQAVGFPNPEALASDGNRVYLLDQSDVKVLDSDLNITRAIDHSGVSLNFNETQLITVANSIRTDSLSAKIGEIIFTSNVGPTAEIYKVALDGTVTLFGTATGHSALTIIPLSHDQAQHLIFGDSLSKTSFTNLGVGGFNETLIESHGLFQGIADAFDTDKYYYAFGDNGIDTASIVSPATNTNLTTEKVYGICLFKEGILSGESRIFVNHDGTLGELNPSTGVITDTAVTGLSKNFGSSRIFTDGVSIWVETTSSTIKEIRDNVVVNEWGSTPAVGVTQAAPLTDKLIVRGAGELFTSNFQLGVVRNVDNQSFETDDGIIADVTDTDVTVFFEGEEGAIGQAFTAGDQATIWYVRKPRQDVVEIKEGLAMIYYVLHLAFEKEIDDQSTRKSNRYLLKYEQVIAREIKKQMKGFINNRAAVRTYYH